MMEELRALDERILSTDADEQVGMEILLRDRSRRIEQFRAQGGTLTEWLELEASGAEIREKLESYRQLVSKNLEAAEQELRRLEAFQLQDEVAPATTGLIDRLG